MPSHYIKWNDDALEENATVASEIEPGTACQFAST